MKTKLLKADKTGQVLADVQYRKIFRRWTAVNGYCRISKKGTNIYIFVTT